MRTIPYDRLLKVALWLIALHSIGFGIFLVILPARIIEVFGFRLVEKFFADQGGVFHLILAIAYIWAALDLENAFKLIVLSVVTKFMATMFLVGYYLIIDPIPMVLFSGIMDFLMGFTILILFRLYRRHHPVNLTAGKLPADHAS